MIIWEGQWFNGVSAELWIEQLGLTPGQGHLCCILGKDMDFNSDSAYLSTQDCISLFQ